MSSTKSIFNLAHYFTFYFIMVSFPLQWISLSNVGGFTLKYVHLSFVIMILFLARMRYTRRLINILYHNRLLVGSYFLLLTVMVLSLVINSNNISVGSNYLLKNLTYFIYFILFLAHLSYFIEISDFKKHFVLAGLATILVFFGVSYLSFSSMGRNFLFELYSGLVAGDGLKIRYDIFVSLFNSGTERTELRSSLRNTLIGAFILIHFTSIMGFFCRSKVLTAVGIFNFLVSLFLIIASVSRSNLLAMVIGYILAFSLSRPKFSALKSYHISSFSLLLILVLPFSLELVERASNALGLIFSRLSELQYDARWEINKESIHGFATNIFIGNGPGATLSDGHQLHNLILGSAYQGGVLGLVFSVVFYLSILRLISRVKDLAKVEMVYSFIFGLLALVSLRAMIAGNAGSFTLIEWYCLSIIITFCYNFNSGKIFSRYRPLTIR